MRLSKDIKKILKPNDITKKLIMTLGNPFRSDDSIGIYIGNKIKSKNNYLVLNVYNVPENYIDEAISYRPNIFIIIDAANFNGKVGEIKILDRNLIPETSLSTHTISPKLIAEIIENETQCDTYFIGIQICSIEYGNNINREVIKNADLLVNYINKFL